MAKKKQTSGIREIATSKQTGGGGFVFEDKVSAWFLSHFLADIKPFTPEIGKIKRIDYQVRGDGWLLEDLLLTTEVSNDIEIKIPISSKSNVQINSKGPNSELLGDIWNEYLNIASDVFDASKDYLCIINSKLHPKISKELNSLIKFSKENDAKLLHQRINQDDKAFSKDLKKLYKGFYCPVNIAKAHNIDESETVKILSRIILVEFDFENAISNDENQIIEVCKNCLLETSGSTEHQLYKNICSIRGELAPLSGFIDYQKLIKKLKNHFQLRGFTNHNNDWNKILETSRLKIDSIPDKIGNKVSFSTLNELEEIQGLIQKNKAVFILGKSGYGKSVLVKKYIQEKLNPNDKFFWVDAQSIQNNKLENHFGVQHNLTDIFNKVQQSNCYLFIDGIDRFFKEAELNLIFPILSVASHPSSSWKIIFTCQIEDYENVLERLYRINITLNIVDFELKTNVSNYVSQLKTHFPVLSELFKHNHLAPILNNLKYLDLLAYNLSTTANISKADFIGESTIIDWIWKKEIDSIGASSSRFIQDFSEKQAQKLSVSIPVSDFSISEISPLDKLKENKVFIEIEDRLYLTHDLFGDWARYKLIRANSRNLKPFLLSKDLFSPLWCKAIRLYGIYLLENNNDASEWIKLFNSLVASEPNEKIIQDLLLESIIFSADSYSHLSALWDVFHQNDGELFNRFLDQFLLKATLPNKNVLKLAEEIGGYSVAEASTYNRVPNYSYWGDILNFIHSKKNEIINISRANTATITKMWLEYTPLNFLYRSECSEIALANAEWMFEFKHNRGFVKGEVDQNIYKAFLMGINEFPNEVIELALKLSKRIQVEKSEKKHDENSNPNKQVKSVFRHAKIRDKIQWPDGPYERVDDAFEKICIDENALNPIIDIFPEKAKEILLALFIEAPKEISFGYDNHYDLDINEPHNWFPPFYTRGPFLYFLNHQPKTGIEFIVSLVNFATNQWTNSFKHKELKIPKLSFKHDDKTLDFIGDERVYFWFRDATGAPHSIVSALMALEKFLLDKVHSEKSIAEYVEIILKNGNSVAYFGVLNSIGKYSHKLFLNELKPMLQVYNFYEWEKSLDYGAHNIEGHQMIGSNFFGKKTWDLAKEWHDMPHRKTSIQSVSLSLFLNNQDLREYYSSVTDSWKKTLSNIESEGYENVYLNKLISFYNYENYDPIENEGRFYYQYKEPENLTIKYKDAREQLTESNDSFIFPYQCFQEVEQEKKYSIEGCEKLWNKIQTYANLNDEYPYSHLSGKHQSVLGGGALLILNKNVWIDKYPDILEWIIEYVDKVLLDYSMDRHDMSQIGMGHSWSQFTANILAMLWPTDLNNKSLKKQIALLLTKASYDTIKILFVSLSKYLKWSDKSFIQIQNLVIIWSSILYKDYKQSQNYNSIANQEDLKTTHNDLILDEHREKLLNDFVDNKINSTLIDWSKLRTVEPKIKQRNWRHDSDFTIGNKPGIDLEMLQHAFSSIPEIEIVDDKERKYLLNLWKQITEQIVFELGNIDENTKQQEDYPNQFHIWALQKIPKLVSQIKPTDNIKADFFWKQILQYGHLASHWVDIFCLHYFLNNIENKEYHSGFFKEWKKMIAYASECKTWNYKRHYRENEIWESLMGVSSSMIKLWDNDDYIDFFKKVILEDIKLMNKKANDQDIIYKVLLVLKTKPGLYTLKEGIDIINKYLNFRKILDKIGTPDGFVRVDFEHEDALAQTTSFLWENHRDRIINNVLTLNGFKQIILFLVANQNPIGIELQRRILMH
tara:strand:+ start:1044 stop:6320 length:5277 start_codon:yes stop_codon:yes gene_type:complete